MDYFVSNKPGGRGNNANDGTSEATPWRDLAPVHMRTLQPGDRILLERGSCWNQELLINDSGTEDAWCELGAYGSGPRPKIIRNGDAVERGIRMTNVSYWRVHDLEVGHAGIGILVMYDTPGHAGLHLEDIYVHDCYGINVGWFPAEGAARKQAEKDRSGLSSGIWITCEPMELEPGEYVMRDIVLDRIEGTYNADSVAITPNSKAFTGHREGEVSYPMRDIVLNHLNFHDDVAPNPGGIPDTLRLIHCENALVQNSLFDNECGRHTNSGTAIVLMVGMKDLTYVNCSFTRTPDTGSHDQCGIDFESTNRNVRVRSCYFGQNAGPGVEFLDIWGEKCFSLDHEVSGSAFEENGWSTHGGQAGSGGIHHYGGNFASAVIRDNLVYEPGKPLYHGEFVNFELINNLVAKQPLSNAIHGFSGEQGLNGWRYQMRGASGDWRDLVAFDEEQQTWSANGDPSAAWVSAMELCTTDPGVTAARTWQAERAGTVAIRGCALKTYGEGADATVQISLNDAIIWGPQQLVAGDWDGAEAHLDGLKVAAGDLIRFEVRGRAGGPRDAVSWAPTVAYVE
jgi:hypothetical protein